MLLLNTFPQKNISDEEGALLEKTVFKTVNSKSYKENRTDFIILIRPKPRATK
jgi:hypothetical protein